MSKIPIAQYIRALKPLGQYKLRGHQLQFDCPHCLKAGSGADKYNLEINTESNIFNCWACRYSGHISKLIKEKGYKEYVDMFSDKKIHDFNKEESLEYEKIFSLPKYIINACNNKEAKEYLLSRGLTEEKIKERNIKFCYSGRFKDCVIFPSYDQYEEVNCFVTHNLKTKKYTVNKKDTFVCFYEMFIDKRSPIFLTEGVYDALSIPNAIPLLGVNISDELLTYLSNTTVILAMDNDLGLKVKKQLYKQLYSVAKKVLQLSFKGKDINESFLKNKTQLVETIQAIYTNKQIYDYQTA